MDRFETIMITLFVVGLLAVLFLGLLQPYFEMRAFNKFSQTKATYWDALMSDLRIIPDK